MFRLIFIVFVVMVAGDHADTNLITTSTPSLIRIIGSNTTDENINNYVTIPTSAALLGPWDLSQRGRRPPKPSTKALMPQLLLATGDHTPYGASTRPTTLHTSVKYDITNEIVTPICNITTCSTFTDWEVGSFSGISPTYLDLKSQSNGTILATNKSMKFSVSSTSSVINVDAVTFNSVNVSVNVTSENEENELSANNRSSMVTASQPPAGGLLKNAVLIDGDILLGALVTVRGAGCGRVSGGGLATAVALRGALSAARGVLRRARLSLGALLLDDCGDDARGLDMALHFIKGSMGQVGGCDDARRVWAVLGASASRTAAHVASLLRLFQIPQVSWGARAAGLSNKARFEYFSRSTASDAAAARALAAVAHALGWTYVSVIYDDSRRGLEAFEALEAALEARGACVAVRERVARGAGGAAYEAALARLLQRPRARAVLLLADERAARLAARAAARRGQRLAWLGGAGWWARAAHPALHGALAVAPRAAPPPALLPRLTALTPGNLTDPWFLEYYEEKFKCTWGGQSPVRTACSPTQVVNLEPHPQLQYVADAVLAFAHAVKSLHAERCGLREGLCEEMKSAGGGELLRYLREVRFTGMSGNEFYFDSNGDGPALYDVINYRRSANGALRWEIIGTFDEGKLQLNVSRIDWGSAGDEGAPASVCAAACGRGEAMHVSSGERCCWRCESCGRHAVAAAGRCTDCPPGTEPDAARLRCEPTPALGVSPRQGAAAAALALAAAGLVASAVVGTLLLAQWRSAMLVAGGALLSLQLLAGVAAAYLLAAVLVLPPSSYVCASQRFGAVVSFSVVYGALLLKTRRVARLAARRSVRELTYAGGCGALAALAASAAAAWQVAAPAPVVTQLVGRKALRTCGAPAGGLAAPALLLLACTVVAVRARSLPHAFGEARHVGSAVYTSCVVWAAWLPLRAVTSVPLRDASTAAAVALAASATLVCVFGPKVYIILLRPERNVWENSCVEREFLGFAGGGGVASSTVSEDVACLTELHGMRAAPPGLGAANAWAGQAPQLRRRSQHSQTAQKELLLDARTLVRR